MLAATVAAASLALGACSVTVNTTGEATNTGNAAEIAPEGNAAIANAEAPAPAEGNAGGETADAGGDAGAQQDFQLTNRSGKTVTQVFVSPADSDQWGPDLLGSETMADVATGRVSFARDNDQCVWDLKVTYEGGETAEVRGANLCETATVTINP